MSATDELKMLLDERGVEWRDNDGDIEFCGADGRMLVAWDAGADREHMLTLTRLTPSQAVEMALGGGKCKTVSMDCFGNPPFNTSGLSGNNTAVGCSECGAPWSTCGLFRGNQLKHNFKACPICGREVER